MAADADTPNVVDPPLRVPYSTDDGFGDAARIGLILLETDQTLEIEARAFDRDGLAFYHARIENEAEVNAETLTAMEARLPGAASLLPRAFGFDAIGYGCTSAATLIGDDAVTAAVQTAHPNVPVANPVSAAADAFHTLGVETIDVLTPYSEAVTMPVIEYFEARGLRVGAVGSFLESDDLTVARIRESSIADGVRQLSEGSTSDAVFISCTSLRSFGIIPTLERELDKPVVSSNLALLWKLLRLAGLDEPIPDRGRLFA